MKPVIELIELLHDSGDQPPHATRSRGVIALVRVAYLTGIPHLGHIHSFIRLLFLLFLL